MNAQRAGAQEATMEPNQVELSDGSLFLPEGGSHNAHKGNGNGDEIRKITEQQESGGFFKPKGLARAAEISE
jgi:hypothetical protein